MKKALFRYKFRFYPALWIAILIIPCYHTYYYFENLLDGTISTRAASANTQKITAMSFPRLKSLLNCTDKSNQPFFQQTGGYMVYYNYIAATETFACHESVTMTTHGEISYVYENLETLIERWRGPISVSILTLKEDYDVAVHIISFLRKCQSELIKQLTTFHFIFKDNYYPERIMKPAEILKISVNCSAGVQNMLQRKTSRSSSNVTYPVNVARNGARRAATTYFVLPSDIELYPSYNFIRRFLRFIENNSTFINRTPVAVFVLPVFEIDQSASVPKNKTELVSLLNNGSAVIFHQMTCPPCQLIPGLESWKKAEENDSLSIISSSKRLGKFAHWEPIYVGTQKEPLFDERLSWEGTKDKFSQMYILCVLNYDFMVLDNAFLIHKPGIKKKGIKPDNEAWRIPYVEAQVEMVTTQIKDEYEKLYGKRSGCLM